MLNAVNSCYSHRNPLKTRVASPTLKRYRRIPCLMQISLNTKTWRVLFSSIWHKNCHHINKSCRPYSAVGDSLDYILPESFPLLNGFYSLCYSKSSNVCNSKTSFSTLQHTWLTGNKGKIKQVKS